MKCEFLQTFFQADIVCYELGFNYGAESMTIESHFGPVPDTFSYDDVICNGSENALDECNHITAENCGSTEGAGVICNTINTPGKNKLLCKIVLFSLGVRSKNSLMVYWHDLGVQGCVSVHLGLWLNQD